MKKLYVEVGYVCNYPFHYGDTYFEPDEYYTVETNETLEQVKQRLLQEYNEIYSIKEKINGDIIARVI